MAALGLRNASAPRTGRSALLQATIEEVGKVVLGKDQQVRLALSGLLARGHVLIEDVPGVGKTTLAHVFAKALGLDFQRIQFTSDLLPGDVLGVSIFDQSRGEFRFQAGPVFTQLVLADEINRATPKTQSALLEAMEEGQVTLDGTTRQLPNPFFVIATQNPSSQLGTFPLPESQLDRFLIRLTLGYPTLDAERALLRGRDRRELVDLVEARLRPEQLATFQDQVPDVHTSDALLDYIQKLLQFTRTSGDYRLGLSPRAGLALLRVAQAWAMIDGRDHVIPEDVQAVVGAVVGHRLQLSHGGPNPNADALVESLLTQVPVP
ncbi:MAG: MoxR family ATPase [Pseudomonadota bacterium]